MKISRQLLCLMIVVVACGYPGAAFAILKDQENGKWSLMGQVKTQVTFRTEDGEPNTPLPYKAGDMTSQRNLFMLEWKQDLGERWKGIKIEYLVKGRAYYDGAWDYGPDVMSAESTRDEYVLNNRKLVDDKKEVDDNKWGADIFNCYVDFTKGGFFSRLGRQTLSWGEMSTIRILDGTNPMNTSSLAVDMQERLIPLWMARFNVAIEGVGPFESLSLGGYYVPGKIDNTYDEKMTDGAPVYPTIGRDYAYELSDPFSMASLKQYLNLTESDIDADRYGVKLGMVYKGLDFNLAYYRMYSELPVPQLQIDDLQTFNVDLGSISIQDPLGSILGDQYLHVVKTRDTVDVYGTSFNYNIGAIDTVLRGEGAFFKDVPMMPPGYLDDVLAALSSKANVVGLNQTVNDLVALFPLGSVATQLLPFTCGEVPKYDVIKYGFGLDKWIKVPVVSKQDILCTFEYVGSKTLDWKRHEIIQPWYAPWDDDKDGHWDTVWAPEYSNTFILILRTNYFNGNLIPQIVTMYEVEPQATVFFPSVRYSFKGVDFDLSWFCTTAKGYEGTLGMLQKKDELSFSITYNF